MQTNGAFLPSGDHTAKSGASNNKISEEQLLNILKSKGKVTRHEIKYKAFNHQSLLCSTSNRLIILTI